MQLEDGKSASAVISTRSLRRKATRHKGEREEEEEDLQEPPARGAEEHVDEEADGQFSYGPLRFGSLFR
jgi:hypothetical protein